MRPWLARGLGLILIGCLIALAGAGELPRSPTGPVVQIIDGDTMDVRLDGRTVRVRDIGIDTPETRHPRKGLEPFGKAAAANRRLVEGQTVRLELDVPPWDRSQRLLASVDVGETMVNAELVRLGDAQVSTFSPNVRDQERFLALQHEAREARRGLWGP